MLERIEGLVIDTVRYSDRFNIVTLYTRTRGRVSFLSPVGTGRNGRLRNARLLPLSAVSADVRFVATRSLQTLGAVIPATIWRDLYFDPAKSAVTMFITEFLNAFLRQSEPDEALYDYIMASVRALDSAGPRACANMHIAFLTGLLPHAGILPSLDDARPGARQWFDMREGTLSNYPPTHRDIVDWGCTSRLPLLLRITTANCGHYRFSRDERRKVLDTLLRYYAVHYPGLGTLKSPDILAETFG